VERRRQRQMCIRDRFLGGEIRLPLNSPEIILTIEKV
jgi:hypothetical protein